MKLVLFLMATAVTLPLAHAEDLSDMQRCMLELLNEASDDMTMGQMREQCRQKIEDSVNQVPLADKKSEPMEKEAAEERLETDKSNVLKPFTLMAHKPNYILLAAHNFNGYDARLYQEQYKEPDIDTDDTEVQFQISIKTPLAVGFFKDTTDLYFAYTNRSFWQLYNKGISSPFRETNHEPEAWVQVRPKWSLWGFKNPVNAFGFAHQSNGQGGVLSRSWNRLYANFDIARGNFVVSLKPWYRIPEDSKDDDNPDITDYLGHGELRTAYKWGRNTFSMMLRNNLESGFSKGAVQFGWSFPLWEYKYLKGYIQYFSGYGESLIDYDHYVNRLGVGISLTDWL